MTCEGEMQHGREKREKRGKLGGRMEKLLMAAVVVLERDTHRGGREAGRLVDFTWPVAASRASAEECREAWMDGSGHGWGRSLGAAGEQCGAAPVFIWHSVPFTVQHQPSLPFACSLLEVKWASTHRQCQG